MTLLLLYLSAKTNTIGITCAPAKNVRKLDPLHAKGRITRNLTEYVNICARKYLRMFLKISVSHRHKNTQISWCRLREFFAYHTALHGANSQALLKCLSPMQRVMRKHVAV